MRADERLMTTTIGIVWSIGNPVHLTHALITVLKSDGVADGATLRVDMYDTMIEHAVSQHAAAHPVPECAVHEWRHARVLLGSTCSPRSSQLFTCMLGRRTPQLLPCCSWVSSQPLHQQPELILCQVKALQALQQAPWHAHSYMRHCMSFAAVPHGAVEASI